MAPSRGKGKSRALNNAATSSRRSTRSSRTANADVPDVYQDLLAEAVEVESAEDPVDRPLKKRKVGAGRTEPTQLQGGGTAEDRGTAGSSSRKVTQPEQTVEDTSDSNNNDDEDESDLAFEDVDLDRAVAGKADQTGNDGIEDLSISVNTATTPNRRTQSKYRNKPISSAEKASRILVHKAHILCLLGHCMYINSWCNNTVVQRHLRSKLSKRTISYLILRSDDSQFQQNRSFMDGLQQASELFRGSFMVTAFGMQRARWPVDRAGDIDLGAADVDPIDRAEFIKAAKDMQGSQDTANQLFCAMLRAVGVEARMVCSLQVLPFTNITAKSGTPQKYTKPTYFATPVSDAAASDSNTEDTTVQASSRIGKVPAARRRLGQPTFALESSATPPSTKKKPVRKLAYPIFWTEAFNTAHQKWIPVDPIVTQSIAKPSKIEPPASYEWNQTSYILAFESDGAAKDVTRRYAKAYNAKTRRLRIESTVDGTQWLKKAMRIFTRRRSQRLDRDQLEDAELAQKEAREGLPGNVMDFRDHPWYALERHLKRHEVIHPKRDVGKVNAGTAAKPRMEVVYRREDVCVCRSADKWFRVGRVVKGGEVPLKRVPARRQPGARGRNGEDGEDGEVEVSPLYALFQTELYVPTPVVKGKVPRNGYGNLDIYVPSMVPAGGTHVNHPFAAQAARILKIDYTDAVTGFQFKGRQGTAVVSGAVVPSERAEAVHAIIEGLEDDQVEEESKARSAMALRVWRRFLTGLRIKERVSRYGTSAGEEEVRMEMNAVDEELEGVNEAGGFILGDTGNGEDVAMPTAGRFSLDELTIPSKKVGGKGRKKRGEASSEEDVEFSSEAGERLEEGEMERSARAIRRRRVVHDESGDEYMPDAESVLPDGDDDGGGGFLLDDAQDTERLDEPFPSNDVEDDESGGGFIPDNEAEMEGIVAGSTGNPSLSGLTHDANEDRDTGSIIATRPHEPGGFLAGKKVHDVATDQVISSIPADSPAIIHEQTPMSILPSTMNNDTATISNRANPWTPDTSDPQTELSMLDVQIMTDEIPTGDRKHVPKGLEVEVTEANTDLDDGTDNGSMMSHDPDDEDAEPDWLESDSN